MGFPGDVDGGSAAAEDDETDETATEPATTPALSGSENALEGIYPTCVSVGT